MDDVLIRITIMPHLTPPSKIIWIPFATLIKHYFLWHLSTSSKFFLDSMLHCCCVYVLTLAFESNLLPPSYREWTKAFIHQGRTQLNRDSEHCDSYVYVYRKKTAHISFNGLVHCSNPSKKADFAHSHR